VAILAVDIGTGHQELAAEFNIAVKCRYMKWGDALVILLVWIRTSPKQHAREVKEPKCHSCT
jgi:hypothetical protein